MNEEEDAMELDNKEECYVEDRLSTVESQSEPTKPSLFLPGDTLRKKVYLLMDDPTSSKPVSYNFMSFCSNDKGILCVTVYLDCHNVGTRQFHNCIIASVLAQSTSCIVSFVERVSY